jgi:hypothetical protein
MRLPSILQSNISLLLYSLLAFIVMMGLWQFIKSRYLLKSGESMQLRSLVPLGLAAAALGFIGLFMEYRDAFELIEAAGDISPAIVAGALKAGWSYPILGLLTLAISCVFRYINQYPFEVTK